MALVCTHVFAYTLGSVMHESHHLICDDIVQVLIVDWDVHHGNGTQNMFLQVLMVYTQ